MGEDNKLYGLIIILLMAVFLSTISLVFQLSGYYFIFEFILLSLLLAASAICIIGLYSGYRWTFSSLTLAMGIALLNTLVLYALLQQVTPVFIIGMVSTAAAFMFSAIKNRNVPQLSLGISEPAPEAELAAGIPSSDANPVSSDVSYDMLSSGIEETFSPGKYVASITGAVFHIPRCEWAKKIKKKKQVWFSDKGEAKEKGYKAHECV